MIYGATAALSSLATLGILVLILAWYVGLCCVLAFVWDTHHRIALAALVVLILSVIAGIAVSAAIYGVPA